MPKKLKIMKILIFTILIMILIVDILLFELIFSVNNRLEKRIQTEEVKCKLYYEDIIQILEK